VLAHHQPPRVPRQVSWNITRQGLLDREAVYWLQFLTPLGDDDVVRITGRYHPVRYFR
jgi:hypothetical protein